MIEHATKSGLLRLKVDGAFGELIMNRPDVLNAANPAWLDDLHDALSELETAKDLRVVTVSGEGRAFSTGIDLRSLSVGEITIDWFRSWEKAMRRIEMLEPITIARMHGYALGGGLQVALVCDLRVASESARLGLPAVFEALIPGLGAHRLPRFVGLGRARRMILTGDLVGAEEALAIGLVDWVAPDGELVQMTRQIAEKLLEGSKTAQCLSKRLANMAFDVDVDAACETYIDYQAQSISSSEHEAAMGIYRRQKGILCD